MKRKIVCGIDLGTTNSVMAQITEAGDAEVVRVAGKDVVRPTVLYVDGDNVLIGEEAENAEALDPDRFIREPKRELGKTNDDGTPLVLFADPITGKQWSVVDLTAEFLSQLKNFVESELDAEIVGCGLSHPAYFDDRARRQLKMAAEQAGLPVVGLVQEPVAALVALQMVDGSSRIVMVYDFGGGTFDCALVRCEAGVAKVIAVDGDAHLGGSDLDMILLEFVLDVFEKEHGYRPDPDDDRFDICALRRQVVIGRHGLSDRDSVKIPVRIRTDHMIVEVTRKQFEKLIKPVVDKTIEITRRCFQEAGVDPKEAEIVTVGGTTRTPLVPSALEKAFSCPVHAAPDRDLVVAKGAALQAVLMGRTQEGNASLQEEAGRLPVPDMKVTTKTAHPLSIVIRKGSGLVHCEMIPAQSDIPCVVEKFFSPVQDHQPRVEILVTQGEHHTPYSDGEEIGKSTLDIAPLPLSERSQTIPVQYRFDESGLIQVHFSDLISGNEGDLETEIKSAIERT